MVSGDTIAGHKKRKKKNPPTLTLALLGKTSVTIDLLKGREREGEGMRRGEGEKGRRGGEGVT